MVFSAGTESRGGRPGEAPPNENRDREPPLRGVLRHRRLILVFAGVAPVIAVLLAFSSIPAAIAVLALSHALVLYPTLRPNSQWLGPVVTRFKPTSREVWLTIDDGPDPIDTPKILDLLDRYQATATFFVKGLLAHAHPDLIREILRRGHSVANHSMTHPSATFWCLPPRRIAWEIDSCGDEIEAVSGIRPRWFRAPVGMKNPFVHPLLERREMALIGWTARGFDAVLHDPDRVVRLVRRNVRPGAIILIHEGHGSNNGQRPEILRKVLQWLQDEHYSFVLPGEEQFRY